MSESGEVSENLETLLNLLYNTRLAFWAFDLEEAAKSVRRTEEIFGKFSKSIQEIVNLMKGLNLEFSAKGHIGRRLAVGEAARARRLETGVLFLSFLELIVKRYNKYIDDMRYYKEKGLVKTKQHSSGARYVVMPIGTEKFELRAYLLPEDTAKNTERFVQSLKKLLREQGFEQEPGVRSLEKFVNEESNRFHAAKFRIFMHDAAADVIVMDDGSASGEILSSDYDRASSIAETILDAATQ